MPISKTEYHQTFSVILKGGGETIIVDNAMIIQLYFIEDIYSWLKCGKLALKDTKTITEFLPLQGDETLTLIYASWIDGKDREEKEYEFDIYKISEIVNVSSAGTITAFGTSAVEFFFVEKQHHRLHNQCFSRSWIDYPYIEIIKEIYEKFVGISAFIEDEPATPLIEFFHTGLKTPADCIKWLTDRIKGDISGESGWLMYSNTKVSGESHNICTLEHLLRDAPLIAPPGDGLYTIGGKNQHYINHMRTADISCVDQTSCDKLMRCNYLGYDIYRKYQIKKEFDYMTSLGHYTCLGAHSLFNAGPIMEKIKKSEEVLTGESGDKHMKLECLLENMYYGEWIKQYCLQQLVSVIVHGHVLRYAGGQIEINWMSGNSDVIFNENYMGRYLIKSITHQFSGVTQPNYIQNLVLIKNGYFGSLGAMTPAAKTNMAQSRDGAASEFGLI